MSLLDFIRRRVGFGELVRWQVDWIPYPRILSHFLLFRVLGFGVIFCHSVVPALRVAQEGIHVKIPQVK